MTTSFKSGIAQMVEQQIVNLRVIGSIPVAGASFNPGLAQFGRAPALGAGGRMFKSFMSCQVLHVPLAQLGRALVSKTKGWKFDSFTVRQMGCSEIGYHMRL